MGSKFKRVFEPITIKGVEYKNRIICTPHVWNWGSRGVMTPEQSACYERLAEGGPAVVTLGNCAVNMNECSDEMAQIDLSDDASIFGISNLRRRIKRYNAVLSAQVNYCGRNSAWPGSVQYAPSAIISPGSLERADMMGVHPEPVYEMSREKIYEIITMYANAAERLKRAGFEMLMLHFAHNNLPGQFFSPISNFRNDEYGIQSMETRTRFARELLQAVRNKVGEDMVIDLRFSGEDVMPGGLQQGDAVEIAKILEPWADIFTISCAFHNAPSYIGDKNSISYYTPELTLRDYTKPFKAALKNSKVVLTTSVINMENAESVLEEGICDFVGMLRPFLADPDIVNKSSRNQEDEVNQCIRCDFHWTAMSDVKPVPCAVNPICGHQPEFPGGKIPPADPVKKILVVGSGPAGMQAALTAGERGHDVTIVEMDDHLGGNLIKAADVSFKHEFKKFVNWIIPRVEKNAKVVLNTKVDAAYVEKMAPDALIIAVGASDVVPPISGVDKEHVHFAWESDNGSVPVGKEVVVIGAGLVGTETATQLAEDGKKVTIVEMLAEGQAMMGKGTLGPPAVARANAAGVEILYESVVEAIEEGFVRIKRLKSGESEELKADTVLLAAGIRPRKDVVDALRHTIAEGDIYIVGDALKGGGSIGNATNTAFEVAAFI